MSAALKLDRRMTPEEFAAFEETSDIRHEYLNGDVIAMAGGTEVHSLVSCNATRALGNALQRRPCRVYESNMRIKIEATGAETYPDCSVVCGTSKFEDLRRQTLLNPLLILEVLSETTEIYDRGKKFFNYRHISSLQEYVLVTPTEPLVEVFTRQPNDEWLMRVYEDLEDHVRFDSLGLSLPLTAFYEKTPVLGVPLGDEAGPGQP
jgi:Uma2 family endonuclease